MDYLHKNDGDEDEFLEKSLYEGGTWEWDDVKNELKFVGRISPESQKTFFIPSGIVRPTQFRDDCMDIIEQQRFKRRIQRRIEGKNDIVTLQDVKDLVLYLAPSSLLSTMIINLLHCSSTERFLRALILYCQYYTQIAETLKLRLTQLEKKIPTTQSERIEEEFQKNLIDLRLLVAKEYCNMILGAGDFRKFHHKGKDKKLMSMSNKEAMIFEPLIRLSVKIVWIALARRNYELIELEVNRLFRSKKYHIVEHNQRIDADELLSDIEKFVFRGDGLRPDTTFGLHSPLFDEFKRARDVDFRLLGLGIMKMQKLNPRLKYLESYMLLEESKFAAHGISLGIVGLQRDRFDIVLHEIQKDTGSKASASVSNFHSPSALMAALLRRRSSTKGSSTKISEATVRLPPYEKIDFPEHDNTEPKPTEFPDKSLPPLVINKVQHRKWIDRVARMKNVHK